MISTLSSWILSIAGIILLASLVELMLPIGAMNKYIKGIFAFIITLVILTPLPKLINQQIDISSFFESENIKIDTDYIYQLNLDKINSLQNDIKTEISNNGYKNVEVYISCDIFDNVFQIKFATIDLTRLVITSNAEHTNIMKIKQQITEIVKKHLNIGEDDIYYEE